MPDKSHGETGKKPTIGWCEYVDLPEWGVSRLRAKVDTGARTSSLHVENLKYLPRGRVSFEVIMNRTTGRRVPVIAKLERISRVRSSLGRSHGRPFVKTAIRLGSVDQEIEINLVDRGELTYRMLLGRTALTPFVVDAARRYAVNSKKKSSKKKSGTRKSK